MVGQKRREHSMGIIGAMFKAAGKEIKKSVGRRRKAILKKASGQPVKVNRSTSTRTKSTKRKKKLPASSATRGKR
jgi:hypothetical protein